MIFVFLYIERKKLEVMFFLFHSFVSSMYNNNGKWPAVHKMFFF